VERELPSRERKFGSQMKKGASTDEEGRACPTKNGLQRL